MCCKRKRVKRYNLYGRIFMCYLCARVIRVYKMSLYIQFCAEKMYIMGILGVVIFAL
jgi:hypothetical protein